MNPVQSQKITPFLWFNNQAEEAVHFYADIFPNSDITSLKKWPEDSPYQPGLVQHAKFRLADFQFYAFDGGAQFEFNPSISFFINCESEQEVDHFWDHLSEGGTPLMPLNEYPFSPKYGWIADKFGVSWQVMLSEVKPAQKIIPSLLFVGDQAGKAQEAMAFYASLFPQSEVRMVFPYGPDQSPNKEGTVAYGDFMLEGQLFAAMDSALEHNYTFNEAISLYVDCEDQPEIDRLWEGFTKDGAESMCGWLQDPYGVWWQIIPRFLGEALQKNDSERSQNMMSALRQMKKLDVEKLKSAYYG